ncbi:lipopolysaccharide biosynthesis protein [Pseudoclavibacter sp. RFBG4]|uniref:lipopolysaccharide biosynthesis protein n=1 Tax=Pseudoclavibacter sp. RFBG4 TaxID=2080575 RepID=UPI002156FD83|nr:lipopolysaccharide biosynthesis protein [Pseudoclavibacter sp. RFBG4]
MSDESSSQGETRRLGDRAARGGLHTGLGQISRVFLQMASVVVLARLLDARDYGLIAMVLAIVGVGEIFRELGLSGAVIQAHTLSRAQRDNLFWISAGAGLVMAVAVAAASPLIAGIYGEPSLIAITIALAPTFFISGLSSPYRAQLTRGMRFGTIAIADVVSGTLALGAGVLFALGGAGYWALVAQQLLSGLISLIVMLIASRWVARMYDRATSVKSFLRLGGAVLATQVMTYVSSNIDAVLIGARYGPTELGYFNRGLQLIRTPTNILRGPVGNVTLPVIAKLQHEPVLVVRFVERAQVLASLPILIMLGWFIACADAVVRLALGDQWLPATVIMQLIAMVEGLSTLTVVVASLLIGLGQVRGLVTLSVVTLVLKVTFLLFALPFGVEAVVFASVVLQLLGIPLAIYYARAVTSLPLGRLMVQSLRILAVTGLATFGAWWVMNAWVPPLAAILEILASGGVLAALLSLGLLFPHVRSDYFVVLSTAQRALKRKAKKSQKVDDVE